MIHLIQGNSGLVIIVFCVTVVSLIGKFTRVLMSKIPEESLINTKAEFQSQSPIKLSRLSHTELKEMKRLLDRQDNLQLAIFFASYQCDLDDVARIHESLKNPINPFLDYADHLAEQNLQNVYDSETYHQLDKKHKLAIEKLQLQSDREIDKDFIKKFGGVVFMENFIMYQHLCHTDPAYFHIPKGNELRHMFETFARHGLALTGQDIPVIDRIRGIDWSRLQLLAGKLGMNRFLHDREDAIQQLSEKPLIEEILNRDFPAEDDYLLLRENWDSNKVELEWSAYLAFAEFLIQSQRVQSNSEEKSESVSA